MLVVSLGSGDVLVLEPDSLQLRRSFNPTQPIEEPEESMTERLKENSGENHSLETFIHSAVVSLNGCVGLKLLRNCKPSGSNTRTSPEPSETTNIPPL